MRLVSLLRFLCRIRPLCLALGGLLWLVPSLSAAQTLVVLPVRYGDGGPHTEASAAHIGEIIVDAAGSAGFAVVKGPPVLEALRAQQCLPDQCGTACMALLRAHFNADDVIVISAADEEQVHYTVQVDFVQRPTIEAAHTAGFFVVLDWLKKALVDALDAPPPAVPDADDAAHSGGVPGAEDAALAGENADADTPGLPKPFRTRTPFWVAAGTTTALGISALAMDIAVNRQYRRLKAQRDRGEDVSARDIRRGESMQVAERFLLGLAVTGAVTTGVLALFTEFRPAPDTATPASQTRGEAQVQAQRKSHWRGGIAAANSGFAVQLGARF